MNVELLQQIKARILASPKSFRMDEWNCGTAMCIAGWACALTKHRWTTDACMSARGLLGGQNPGVVGAEALGLTAFDLERPFRDDQANRLFFVSSWPLAFRNAYHDRAYDEYGNDREEDVDYAALARIAAQRIDHFIATNGAE